MREVEGDVADCEEEIEHEERERCRSFSWFYIARDVEVDRSCY